MIITGTLHEDQHAFMTISCSVLCRMRNDSDKSCTENQSTHFTNLTVAPCIFVESLQSIKPTNEHIISHKNFYQNILKNSNMFRSCQIIIRELCSLLKLCYSIHNSIRICKQVVVAACHVV